MADTALRRVRTLDVTETWQPHAQQLVARIKRSSKYWGQTEPNQWFDVRVVDDRSYHLRGNSNNYRLSDVAIGVKLDNGIILELATGKRHATEAANG